MTARECKACHSRMGVLLCSRCKSVGYCTKECQIKDWKAGHRDVCVKGDNKLAGSIYTAFPADGPDKSGADNFVTYDNDECLGKQGCEMKTLEYLSDKKYGQHTAGQPTVLLFWGQYHKPTYKFMPLYSVLQAKYKNKVQFVGVSLDPNTSYPQKFLDDADGDQSKFFKTEIAIAHDAGLVLKKHYGAALDDILSLPHSFVLDAKGNIVWHQDHSELGATVPNYCHLMEKQLDLLVDGKPLHKVGDRPVPSSDEEEDEEDGEEVEVGDLDDLGLW